jgi:hypothetical protein
MSSETSHPALRNSGIIRHDSGSVMLHRMSSPVSFAPSNFAGGSTIDFPLLTPMFGLRLVHTY